MRVNSLTFAVTMVAAKAQACAAISRSFDPIDAWPAFRPKHR
jgi:hypothetical protein